MAAETRRFHTHTPPQLTQGSSAQYLVGGGVKGRGCVGKESGGKSRASARADRESQSGPRLPHYEGSASACPANGATPDFGCGWMREAEA